MARFEGKHSERVIVDAPLPAVRDHFASLEATLAATGDIERSAIDGDTIHYVLKAQDLGVVKFQSDFRCRYTLEGDELRWATVEGNTHQQGRARFSASEAGTAIDFEEQIAVDMDVPKMMAGMLKPVVAQVLAHEVKGFLGRMVKSVPR